MRATAEGIECWIEVDGRRLEEYAIHTPHPGTIACWIASQPAKPFLLAIGTNGTLPSLRIELANDGKLTSGGFIEGGRIFQGRISAFQVAGEFKRLEFNTNTSVGVTSCSGAIQVNVHRLEYTREHQSGMPYHRGQLHGFDCVSVGRIRRDLQVHRRRCVLYEVVPLDIVHPWCTLIFNYREIGVLQEQGIVPYVQSPSGDYVALHRQREEYTGIYEPIYRYFNWYVGGRHREQQRLL